MSGDSIYLRRLTEDDATEKYVSWLNDPDINRYLESRFITQTIDSVRSFIKSVSNDNNYQFGIFDIKTDEHIGNIKIGGINHYHRFADIGFLIGEKEYWGKGLATEAIRLATDFAFNELHLHKVFGGAYAPNIGSCRAFEKNGYIKEGVKYSQYLTDEGVYVDDILYGKVNE